MNLSNKSRQIWFVPSQLIGDKACRETTELIGRCAIDKFLRAELNHKYSMSNSWGFLKKIIILRIWRKTRNASESSKINYRPITVVVCITRPRHYIQFRVDTKARCYQWMKTLPNSKTMRFRLAASTHNRIVRMKLLNLLSKNLLKAISTRRLAWSVTNGSPSSSPMRTCFKKVCRSESLALRGK